MGDDVVIDAGGEDGKCELRETGHVQGLSQTEIDDTVAVEDYVTGVDLGDLAELHSLGVVSGVVLVVVAGHAQVANEVVLQFIVGEGAALEIEHLAVGHLGAVGLAVAVVPAYIGRDQTGFDELAAGIVIVIGIELAEGVELSIGAQ